MVKRIRIIKIVVVVCPYLYVSHILIHYFLWFSLLKYVAMASAIGIDGRCAAIGVVPAVGVWAVGAGHADSRARRGASSACLKSSLMRAVRLY